MKIRIAALLLALGIPVSAFATVGGPQNIEVLGYEVKDQKLYLLRHYLDDRGRLPQLYYYNFKSKTPNQLIQVNSLYINPKPSRLTTIRTAVSLTRKLPKLKSD